MAQTTPYRPSSNPLVGLINTIGFKITNTADFIAGMLRGTIQVIEKIKRKKLISLNKKLRKFNKIK